MAISASEAEYLRDYLTTTHQADETGVLHATIPQAMKVLEKMGILAGKPRKGIPDDLRHALRMFTDTNYLGLILPGIEGEKGKPPSLAELYKTADAIGVAWNYGLGWISSLREGWNEAGVEGERRGVELIKALKEESKKNIKEFKDYLNNVYKNNLTPLAGGYANQKALEKVTNYNTKEIGALVGVLYAAGNPDGTNTLVEMVGYENLPVGFEDGVRAVKIVKEFGDIDDEAIPGTAYSFGKIMRASRDNATYT